MVLTSVFFYSSCNTMKFPAKPGGCAGRFVVAPAEGFWPAQLHFDQARPHNFKLLLSSINKRHQ